MKRLNYIILANAMLVGNLVSNLVGRAMTGLMNLAGYAVDPSIASPTAILGQFGDMYTWIAFIFGCVVTLWYEWPIRRVLKNLPQPGETSSKDLASARSRVLNEPYFAVVLNLFLWFVSAAILGLLAWPNPETRPLAPGMIGRGILTGLITATISFFLLEHILQHRIAPVLFPQGGLWSTPGVRRIRVGTRQAALFLAACLSPLLAILLTIRGAKRNLSRWGGEPSEVLDSLMAVVSTETILFMAVGAGLAFFVTINITRPLKDIISVLQKVRRGEFKHLVQVVSTDEIGYTGDSINLMTRGLSEREMIKETFGKYVSPLIRDEILAGRIPLEGELKDVTIVFVDLRGFTPLVESTPPREVVKIINGYFEQMDQAIDDSHGLVLQYIGDEIEAVFGAPLPREDHADLAVQAALEMRRLLQSYNRELQDKGYSPLSHGIGIHSGQVLAGNIGSSQRISYSLVGDAVNLASRIQGLTKKMGGDILISSETRKRLKGPYQLEPFPEVEVKGKARPVKVFGVQGQA